MPLDGVDVDVIVVLNRCTDQTETIAKSFGACVIVEDRKNLSAIKNAGVAYSDAEWIVTIDADSWVSGGVLASIVRHANSINTVGGGIRMAPERWSLGIGIGYAMMLVPAFFLRLSFGLYWFRKADFHAIGGVSETRHIAEDADFLARLKAHGRRTGRPHHKITDASIITSCRKFDDWHFVRLFANPCVVRQAIAGNNRRYLDKN